MPDESITRKKVDELAQAGVDGCFYWYDNNWHYIRKWEHLKNLQSAARLPLKLLRNAPDYQQVKMPRSDEIMSRTISMQIKLSWTEEDIARRTEKMIKVLN